MKKHYLLFAAFVLCSFANAQFEFSDDFESYSVGDYVGSNSSYWTTWSGDVGTTEDVQVTNVLANESSNSIYFSSTASDGGPQDVVVDFGEVFTSGDFVFESSFYINQSSGAYFNFQAESEIGETWALDCSMSNGAISIENSSTPMVTGTYPQAAWFTLRVEADLTTNNWEVFVGGVSIGTFSNPVNQLASLDIFPVQGNQFYVDNISISHAPYVLPNLNGAMMLINPIEGLVSQERFATLEVKNLGLTTINSFDVVLDYVGSEITESVSGISLNSYESMMVEFTTPIILSQGEADLTATISAINGAIGPDDNLDDDVKVVPVNAIKPANGKIVIAEEGTGTWCGWCPRGTVAMDLMAHNYEGYYQGIAVHNGDPMTVPLYDADLEVSGYPSALVDRGSEIDPGVIKTDFMQRIVIEPSAIITNGAAMVGDSLNVSLTVDFNTTVSGNWKIACVLTEDGVSGTANNYSQSNYYSGGADGDLIGLDGTNWADLPGTVNASNMVYDHVARALSPSFNGYAGFPNSIESGGSYTFNFKFGMDANWKAEDMHIVGMLMDASGRTDNGSSSTIDAAIANGFVNGSEVLATTDLEQFDAVLNLYPNPTTDYLKLAFNIKQASDVQINILNVAGQIVANNKYTGIVGAQTLPLNVSGFSVGLYTVELLINGEVISKQFVKQ